MTMAGRSDVGESGQLGRRARSPNATSIRANQIRDVPTTHRPTSHAATSGATSYQTTTVVEPFGVSWRTSMCRKRPFATHGWGRRPASTSVCRFPCLILSLAYVSRNSMTRRTVLTSPARRFCSSGGSWRRGCWCNFWRKPGCNRRAGTRQLDHAIPEQPETLAKSVGIHLAGRAGRSTSRQHVRRRSRCDSTAHFRYATPHLHRRQLTSDSLGEQSTGSGLLSD